MYLPEYFSTAEYGECSSLLYPVLDAHQWEASLQETWLSFTAEFLESFHFAQCQFGHGVNTSASSNSAISSDTHYTSRSAWFAT
jgi:hypothetical protein